MNNFPSMDLYATRMTKVICLVFVLISGGGLLFFRDSNSAVFSLGAAISCASNILKVYWLKNTVARATALDASMGSNFVRGQGMLRMFFTLAILVGAGFLSQMEALGMPFLVGAILGLLSMPLAGYSMGFFARADYMNNTESNKGADTDV
ncbi:MAG: hypothetical protein FWC71_09795 [Defluviitaleaceae bacterium]|nr:hypothetical protein [Defluviitaleaceae bacterium]